MTGTLHAIRKCITPIKLYVKYRVKEINTAGNGGYKSFLCHGHKGSVTWVFAALNSTMRPRPNFIPKKHGLSHTHTEHNDNALATVPSRYCSLAATVRSSLDGYRSLQATVPSRLAGTVAGEATVPSTQSRSRYR